jgi:integrase
MATFVKIPTGVQAIIRRGSIKKKRAFDTRREAEAWARSVEAEIDGGRGAELLRQQEAARTTLGQILERYGREVTPSKKGAERESYALRQLHKDLGHMPCSLITSTVIANWRDDRLKNVAPATVNRELNSLSAVLNHAAREWRISVENHIPNVRRPKNPRGRERRLSAEEETHLLNALRSRQRRSDGTLSSGATSPWPRLVVLFALETAMRQSEILSIEWRHVTARTAHLMDTKNGKSRTVPLSKRARAVLRLAGWKSEREGRVFPITTDLLKRAYTRAIARARRKYQEASEKPAEGFLGDLTFHDLRHEATSRLATKLPNVIELAAVTGHEDLRMLKRYYHTTAEELAAKLD